MKRILALLAVLCLSLMLIGLAPDVTAKAELGDKDVVYGDNYIVPDNDNPKTNDKETKLPSVLPKETEGVALFTVAIVITCAYAGFVVYRVIRRKRHEES